MRTRALRAKGAQVPSSVPGAKYVVPVVGLALLAGALAVPLL